MDTANLIIGYVDNGSPTEATFYALLAGVVPSLIWLAFWLLEDRRHPEPKRFLLLTFLLGMGTVPIALYFQRLADGYFPFGSFALLFVWAASEEILKFLAAGVTLIKRVNNEPVDSMVYLVTAALGYAALENAFFLYGPIGAGDISTSITAGNFRFIGSTLVHVLSSAAIGIFLAYAYCRPKWKKVPAIFVGVLCASVLHTIYNTLILNTEINFFIIFGGIWAGIAVVLVFFEIVKRKNPYCRVK